MRRILEIISTNRVDNEDEVAQLSELMSLANISSDDRRYDKLMDSVMMMDIHQRPVLHDDYEPLFVSLQISPNCSEMVVYCSWEGKEEDCNELFQTEATDDGMEHFSKLVLLVLIVFLFFCWHQVIAVLSTPSFYPRIKRKRNQ